MNTKENTPVYRGLNYGLDTLSDSEIISIIFRGSENNDTMRQARNLLELAGGSFRTLGRKKTEELEQVRGIGKSKALALLAAIELGRRCFAEKNEYLTLNSSQAIYEFIRPKLAFLNHEEAHLLLMNNSLKLVKTVKLSEGGLTETSVDVRALVKEALLANATIIVLCHNHPSNNRTPSLDDDRITEKISKACKLMRLNIVDHIIVTDDNYYSYNDEGRL